MRALALLLFLILIGSLIYVLLDMRHRAKSLNDLHHQRTDGDADITDEERN